MCALWSSTDEKGEPLDDYCGIDDFATEALETIISECSDFQQRNISALAAVDPESAGHDFWLTRNRHGAGFWDRGWGEVGNELTRAAHAYGECDLYIGDDGQVYLCRA